MECYNVVMKGEKTKVTCSIQLARRTTLTLKKQGRDGFKYMYMVYLDLKMMVGW